MYPDTLSGIHFGELYIHEPGSVLTNGFICLMAAWLFAKIPSKGSSTVQQWRFFIACLGLAAFGGLFSHGVPLLFSKAGFYSLWSIKNVFILVGNAFASLALWRLLRGHEAAMSFKLFLLVKAAMATVAMVMSLSFTPVVVDLGLTYIFALAVTAYRYKSGSSEAFLFYAFLTAFLSGLLYMKPWYIHAQWLTHSDVVHLFALLSMWFIYRYTADARPVSVALHKPAMDTAEVIQGKILR